MSPLLWGSQNLRRAGRGPELRWWGTEPVNPRGTDSSAPGRAHLCIPPPAVPGQRKGSQCQGTLVTPAGESRAQVLTWHLALPGCAGAGCGPGCLHTQPGQRWACPSAPLAAAQLTTGESCLLCAPILGSDKPLGVILGKSFFFRLYFA